jgi:hypothetical protein
MLGFYLEAGYQTRILYDKAGEILTDIALAIQKDEARIVRQAREYGAEDREEKTVEEAVHYYCTTDGAFSIADNDIRLHSAGSVLLKEIICRSIVLLIITDCFKQGVNVDLQCS